MRFREAEKYIKDDGWYHVRTRGSHYSYNHHVKPGTVTIPFHRGDLDPGTIKSVFRNAGLPELIRRLKL